MNEKQREQFYNGAQWAAMSYHGYVASAVIDRLYKKHENDIVDGMKPMDLFQYGERAYRDFLRDVQAVGLRHDVTRNVGGTI